MNISKNDMTLYLVTDRRWLKKGEKLADAVETALKNGVTCVQLREKNASYREFLSLAMELKAVCRKYGVPFIVNDNVEIAAAVDADGVHIGQGDMSIAQARALLGYNKIIGTSAHNVTEALKAVADGADYIGCGAVFGSETKTDATFLGVDGLGKICRRVNIPVVAIGGITAENTPLLAGTGTDGIAVVSAILAQQDVDHATQTMLTLARKIKE